VIGAHGSAGECYGQTISPTKVRTDAEHDPPEPDRSTNETSVMPMPITRMNHAVLYVRDARRTQQFYADVLGFSTVIEHPQGAFVFMRAPSSDNHHDIAFFTIGQGAAPSEAGARTVGLYHLAWEVPTLAELAEMREKLRAAGALVGQSDHGANKSLYAHDPDGLEFEVMWLVPAEHGGDAEHAAIVDPLDLDAERAHFATVGLS
jgi:catechol-2,3-dioxygenase